MQDSRSDSHLPPVFEGDSAPPPIIPNAGEGMDAGDPGMIPLSGPTMVRGSIRAKCLLELGRSSGDRRYLRPRAAGLASPHTPGLHPAGRGGAV